MLVPFAWETYLLPRATTLKLHIHNSKMKSNFVASDSPCKLRCVLMTRYRPEPISSEALVKYNGACYHLLLEYNKDAMDCMENRFLQRVYDAFVESRARKRGERDTSLQAQLDCLELFWPFVAGRIESKGEKPDHAHIAEQKPEMSVVKIRLKTVDGLLCALEHDLVLKPVPKEPVANPYSDLRVFAKDEIDCLEEKELGIKKVRIGDSLYCVKTVLRSKNANYFLREIETLRKIPLHPNIVHLVGVTDAGDGKIDGMVLSYLADAKPLLTLETAVPNAQKSKWKTEVSGAVNFLHKRGIVWGDAAADNVLICGNGRKAVLIDFEGGAKVDWIEHGFEGKKEGDLQGLEQILQFIDNLKTRVSVSDEYATL